MNAATAPCPTTAAVTGLIPMAHVASVRRSIAFYELFGFKVDNSLSGGDGDFNWAAMQNNLAQIMFARGSGPIDAGQQAVLFYLYTEDVAAMRKHLLASGVPSADRLCHTPLPVDPRGAVFEITRPNYMPAGEMRVHDPDGYVLLVGQLA